MIPLLPLLGYAYGFSQFYGIARLTGIALSTANAEHQKEERCLPLE